MPCIHLDPSTTYAYSTEGRKIEQVTGPAPRLRLLEDMKHFSDIVVE